jgi:8-oxo-dGTP pyrophosphatase MutT (NUDIX family)
MNAPSSILPTGNYAQVAALPLKLGDDGVARVLLLTSRETRRWVIPKGWPMKGRKAHEAAAHEALEEAGVAGHAEKTPIGRYYYFKRRASHFDVCQVDLHAEGGKAAQELARKGPTGSPMVHARRSGRTGARAGTSRSFAEPRPARSGVDSPMGMWGRPAAT